MRKSEFLARLEQLPGGVLWVFVIKQGWAALFGGLMLTAIIATNYIDLPWFNRYDWLFLFAIAIQIFMLVAKLEKPHEVITIVLFHLVGLGMELFKTSGSIGSWNYPGEAFFHAGNVPLFSGFMYAAVGSYMARAWRVFDLQFSRYPNRVAVSLVAVAIYINFFTHHFVWDVRWLLFVVLAVLYGRTMVRYTLHTKRHRMPMLLAFGLIAGVIWLAENIGTFTTVWLYPNQVDVWQPVGLQKMGSWFLLIVISFIMVELLHFFRQRWLQRA